MGILTIIMAVILGILLVRHYLLLNGIKQIRKQIKDIYEADGTNQQVTNPHNFSELSKLVIEINIVLAMNQKNHIYFREIQQEIKEQITNISHDLRTPLASILGYFELIHDEEATLEEKGQYLDIIEKRAGLLRSLLDNYYDLVQIDSEAQEFQMTVVDIKEVLTDVLATFYYDFIDKKMTIEIIGELDNLKVLADQALLQRIFINLIQNVLKHGEKQCEISHEKHERQVCTVIKNRVANGNRIEIEKVFNRLYSADKTRNTGNTGIGLTITKLLIEKMGHKIEAKLTKNGWFLIEIKWQI